MSVRTTIGRYRVEGKLGEGGMGVVYAARDERLDRRVAIKTLRPSGDDEGARARLWREARAAASVSHPNVCQLFEVGEEGDDLFIAMELLEGESLAARLSRGPIAIAEAGRMALAILGALEALHHRQVIHRDLKPSNVFVTPHGIKLLDFGLARPAGAPAGGPTLTQPGLVIGTPRYMAPEQWRGEPADARTDVFAVGVLLFEMLTGKPAFGGETAYEACHAILHAQPPALAGSPEVASLDGVIQRALEKRPDQRYPTAEAMANDLRHALAHMHAPDAARVQTLTRLMVLPFRLLRSDPEIDFLAFSLPDAITTSLSGLESLVVRSSHAAARYTGEAVDLKTIASESEVDALVLGTLLRAGDQVRVSTQLVEAPSGTVVWSRTAQFPLHDVFQLQDELTRVIVESLALPLSAREKTQLQRDVPASARAYEHYLRANQIGHDYSILGVARDLYRSALEEDANYAPAWARLGRVLRVMSKYGTDSVTNLRLAEEAFRKALALNPGSTLVHNLYTHFEVEDIGRSRDALARLLGRVRSRAADPELFAGLVMACRFCGLLEASLAADRRARRLDPHIRTSVMYTHFMVGDWERAVATDDEDVPYMRGYALPLLGREEEAVAVYRELGQRRIPVAIQWIAQGTWAAIERRHDEAVEENRKVIESTFSDGEGLYFTARNFARVGKDDLALATLERVVERQFCCPQILTRDPWLDPLRAEPRFGAVLERAEAGRREAMRVYLEHEGERLLGAAPG